MTYVTHWCDPLHVEIVGYRKKRVVEDIGVWSERLHRTFTIPKGFVFDGDSVPRIPGVHALFKGRALRESALHDWLYFSGEVSRKEADLVFLDSMYTSGVHWMYRYPIFFAVRFGGGSGWRRYRRADSCRQILIL